MIKIIFFCLLFYPINSETAKEPVTINFSIGKELIESIKEGSKNINTVQDNSIMVLGNTGSGKSTLINYLSGVPFEIEK